MDAINTLADQLRRPSAPLRVVSGVAVAVPDASHVLVSVGDRAVTAWLPASIRAGVGDAVRLLVGGNTAEVLSVSASPQWVAPALSGGWVDHLAGLAPTGFRRVGDVVEMRGAIKSGALGDVFMLPPDFRPTAGGHLFVVPAGTGMARVLVNWTGAVSVQFYAAGGTNAIVSLDGVRFSTL